MTKLNIYPKPLRGKLEMKSNTPMEVFGMQWLKENIRNIKEGEYFTSQPYLSTGKRSAKADIENEKWTGLCVVDIDDHDDIFKPDWNDLVDAFSESSLPGLHYVQKSKSGHGIHLVFECDSTNLEELPAYHKVITGNCKVWMNSTEWEYMIRLDEKGKLFDNSLSQPTRMLNWSHYPIVPVYNAKKIRLHGKTFETVLSEMEEKIRDIKESKTDFVFEPIWNAVDKGRSLDDGLFEHIQRTKLYESLFLYIMYHKTLDKNWPRKNGKSWNKLIVNHTTLPDVKMKVENGDYLSEYFKHQWKKCYIIPTGCGKTYYMAQYMVKGKPMLYCTFRKALLDDMKDDSWKWKDNTKGITENFGVYKGNELKEVVEAKQNIITTVQSLSCIDDEHWNLLKDYEIFIDEVHLFDEFDNEDVVSRLLEYDKVSCYTASDTETTKLLMKEYGYEMEYIQLPVKNKQKATVYFFNHSVCSKFEREVLKNDLYKIIDWCMENKKRPLVYMNSKEVINSIQHKYGTNNCDVYFTKEDEKTDERIEKMKRNDHIVCTTSKLGVGVSFKDRFDAVIAVTENPYELQQICARERKNDLIVFAIVPTYRPGVKAVARGDNFNFDYTFPYWGKKVETVDLHDKQKLRIYNSIIRNNRMKNIDFTVTGMRYVLKQSFDIDVPGDQGLFTTFSTTKNLEYSEGTRKNIRWKSIFCEWKKAVEQGEWIPSNGFSPIENDYCARAFNKYTNDRSSVEGYEKWNTQDFRDWFTNDEKKDSVKESSEYIVWKRKDGRKCFDLKETLNKMKEEGADDELIRLVSRDLKTKYRMDWKLGGYVDPREAGGKAVGKANSKMKAKEAEMRKLFEQYHNESYKPTKVERTYWRRKGWL